MATKPLLRPPGLVLAGGRSSRMGANKALLSLGGDIILGHVVHRLTPQVSKIAINAAEPLPGFADLPLVTDAPSGQLGPLAGILGGMRHHASAHDGPTHFLSAPCDSPFLPLDLAERLAELAPDAETIVIASSLGRTHPVFALWPTALADDLESWLGDEDNRRISTFLARHHVVTVDFPPVTTDHGQLDPFLNINTPEDLALALTFTEVLP